MRCRTRAPRLPRPRRRDRARMRAARRARRTRAPPERVRRSSRCSSCARGRADLHRSSGDGCASGETLQVSTPASRIGAARGSMSVNRLRDQAAIVGIGQTPYSKGLGRSEFDMAVEAILAACADAGIAPREIDGVVRYDMETTDEEQLLSVVGPELRYQASTGWGGGGSVSVLVHAAMAIAMGMADHVLVFRSRARGKNSVFGKNAVLGGRYWERIPERQPDLTQWHVPHGLVSAFQEMAMITRRHMIEYGTTEEQLAEVAVATRRHAMRNPNAVMRTPMTVEDHHRSRRIAEPLRLFDCNIETDGACALIVSSRERARDLRQPP